MITQPMLAVNVKAESYIHKFNGRVRIQPPMIIYLPVQSMHLNKSQAKLAPNISSLCRDATRLF